MLTKSLYRSVLKEAAASTERSKVMMGVMTGASVFYGQPKPSTIRAEIRQRFMSEKASPVGLCKALWSVKQLRDLKKLESSKARSSMVDTMPFAKEFKGGAGAVTHKEASKIKFTFQGRCVDQLEDGTYKYRVCVHSSLLLPAASSSPSPTSSPPVSITIEECHLFVLDSDMGTLRKVLNCGPLGKPFAHTRDTPSTYFECTVSSPCRSPVIRALVCLRCSDEKEGSTYVTLDPIVLDPVGKKYPETVPGYSPIRSDTFFRLF